MTSPLPLPPTAALHLNAPPPQYHHDSEKFLNQDKHRVAQELSDLRTRTSLHGSIPLDAASFRSNRRASQASTAADSLASGHGARELRLRRQTPRWYDGIVRFWGRNVSVTVEMGAQRDHLALERTFLAYLRTSLALVMTGVFTAQLFRLQHAPAPDPRVGFYVTGVPLAATFMVLGIVVLMLGAVRFWRQQGAMVRGKVYAGGWEMLGIMVGSLAICAVTFGLVVWIDVEKSYK